MIANIKNTQLLTDPWPHKIVDNMFDQSTLSKLVEAANALSKYAEEGKSKSIWLNQLNQYGIDDDVVEIITSITNELLDNVSNLVDDFPYNTKSTSGYFAIPKFEVSGKHYQFPIHADSSNKTILFITYLDPQVQRGTLLYTSEDEKDFVHEVDWAPNRAFVMCPKNNDFNWHTWKNTLDSARVTLNISCQRLETLSELQLHLPEEDLASGTLWLYDQFGKDRLISNRI
jgi:hypothetical protein